MPLQIKYRSLISIILLLCSCLSQSNSILEFKMRRVMHHRDCNWMARRHIPSYRVLFGIRNRRMRRNVICSKRNIFRNIVSPFDLIHKISYWIVLYNHIGRQSPSMRHSNDHMLQIQTGILISPWSRPNQSMQCRNQRLGPFSWIPLVVSKLLVQEMLELFSHEEEGEGVDSFALC